MIPFVFKRVGKDEYFMEVGDKAVSMKSWFRVVHLGESVQLPLLSRLEVAIPREFLE